MCFTTFQAMAKDVQNGVMDLVLHYGDIACVYLFTQYTHISSDADDRHPASSNSWVNDEFMNKIQPIAARVPYMVCPGNHDTQFDYAALLNRYDLLTKCFFNISDS